MTRRDDHDWLSVPVPAAEDDAEPSAAELAHAKSFAQLIDHAVAGTGRAPAAMSADERALLEVATAIRATHGGLELAPSRQRAVVEDALRAAIGAGAPVASASGLSVVPLAASSRAGGRRRWLPWAISAASVAVAAAAVLALWLRAPATVMPPAPTAQVVPATMRSRPSDSLIGPIARERAADASARLDEIFADRLDGFRELSLRERGRRR